MKEKIIIVGASPTMLDDLKKIPGKIKDYDFIAVGKDAINNILPISYVATYHTSDIKDIKNSMSHNHLNSPYKIISHIQAEKNEVDIIIPFNSPSGSSALLAVLAALKLGYKKIILCGCPLEGISKSQPYDNYKRFHKGWEVKYPEIKDKVRSMSGFTMTLLGSPTEEWLKNG